MSGEIYSYLFPKLLSMGVKDIYLTNIMMKKNRPAQKLSVLCEKDNRKEIEKVIYKETTTLGIRRKKIKRSCLKRKFYDFNSSFGQVKIKAAYYEGELLKIAPEYEECKKIALKEELPLKDVMHSIKAEAAEELF